MNIFNIDNNDDIKVVEFDFEEDYTVYNIKQTIVNKYKIVNYDDVHVYKSKNNIFSKNDIYDGEIVNLNCTYYYKIEKKEKHKHINLKTGLTVNELNNIDIFIYPGGEIYEGGVLNGTRNGYGKLSTNIYIQEGYFIYDNFIKGTMFFFLLNEKLEGEFTNNMLNGTGKITKSSKHEFLEGVFVNNVLNGFGMQKSLLGTESGIYVNNLLNGLGTRLIYTNKEDKITHYIEKGEFIKGILTCGQRIFDTHTDSILIEIDPQY